MMSYSMDTEPLDGDICLEEDSHDSDLGDEGIEESSEEEVDEEYEDEDVEEPETPRGTDGQMIENYDRRELISATGCKGLEPYEGLQFDSEDAAREFYCSYAKGAGFRVRVSKCRRSTHDGAVICRRFVCSMDSFHEQKGHLGVRCMARLVAKRQSSGKWLVTKFEREHNHDSLSRKRVEIKSHSIGGVKKIENPDEDLEGPKIENCMIQPQGDPNLEPYEGMEFQSQEAARAFYYEYAKNLGFTVRISKCRRAKDGMIICRRFVCSKEGYYVRKYGQTKRSRALTRVGCMARLIVKKQDSGSWTVVNFEREHNHPPFVVGKELSYQPPNPTRRVSRAARFTSETSSGTILGNSELDMQNSPCSVTWRFNKLHQEGIRFAEEGASSVEIFNVAMLALKEAFQRVIAAKESTMRDSQLGSSGTGSNQGSDGSRLMLSTNLGNETNLKPQISEEFRQASSQGEVMFIQQPVNLVLIAPGMQSECGQAPLSINIPNGQGVQGSSDCPQINITVPVSGQKSDGKGLLASARNPTVKRRKRNPGDSDMAQCNENDTRAQEWNIIADSNTISGGKPTNVALSYAQVAALQAVAEAFNVPTMGATSSSAPPINVSPVAGEHSEVCERYVQELQEAPKTQFGPNPLVHAAAIAAGARIASPAVAASLIKAVQSRTAIHVKRGGSIPKLSTRGRDLSPFPNSPVGQQPGKLHFICTRDSPPPVPPVPVLDNQEACIAEGSEVESAMDEQGDLLDIKAGEDWMVGQGHYHITTDHDLDDEHMYTGSSSS